LGEDYDAENSVYIKETQVYWKRTQKKLSIHTHTQQTRTSLV